MSQAFNEDEDEDLPPEFAVALARVAREMLELGDGDRILARFGKYKDDPIAFFVDVLGVTPWESEDPKQQGQADILRAVASEDRVAVKSGHKVSKSCTAAGLAVWWVCTRVGARAVLTAPTFNQVKGIIWRELRARFRERSLASQLGAELPLDPSTGLQLPNGNEILGLSTKTPENLAGLSAPNLFFIVDEASGYPDELFAVIMGNSAGGSKIFAITNPTRTSGWFFKLFKTRAKGWVLITISSENTPNVRARKKLIPGLATWEWVEEMREKCGPDWENDAEYMVRVCGGFPPQGSDAVIGVRDVERAEARWKPDPPAAHDGELTLGVDIARFGGDANVIQPVRGTYAWEPIEVDVSAARDATDIAAGQLVADAVIRTAKVLRNGLEVVRVNIDGNGVGASAVDALKLSKPVQEGWIYMVDLNVGEAADEVKDTADPNEKAHTNYTNLRAQLWFGCKDWIKTGAITKHDELQGELLAATFTYDDRGRKKVAKKDIMREVLGRSPDYADALCLAVYRGTRGTWTKVEYTAASDPRHPGGVAPQKPGIDDWTDDDDDASGGGAYSFL